MSQNPQFIVHNPADWSGTAYIEAAEAECTKRNAAEDAAAQDDFEAGNAAWAASFVA